MNLTKSANLLVLGLVLAVAAAGCKKRPGQITPLPGAPTARITDESGGGRPLPVEPGPGSNVSGSNVNPSNTSGIPSNPEGSHEGWVENRDALQADTVYFAFDSSTIRPSETSKVSAIADYLKNNAGAAVRVEGNCDERGTEEYNRALGERRALALREALVAQGVAPGRVDTISYGKDRPADPGHDESAWQKNRRDDVVVLTPPNK